MYIHGIKKYNCTLQFYLDVRYAEAILCAIMLLNRKVVNINPDIYKDTAKQKLGRTWLEFHDEITQGSYM